MWGLIMVSNVLTNVGQPSIIGKNQRELTMTKEKWFSIALFLPGMIILTLGLIGLFTDIEVINRILIIIGVIFLVLSICIIGLKYSHFFTILNIHNPIVGHSVENIATVFTVWAIFAVMFFAIPHVMDLVDTSNQINTIDNGINEILNKIDELINHLGITIP
jgi:TM2 domain-containing membrane protein YozV